MKDKIIAYILASFVSSVITVAAVPAVIWLKSGEYSASGLLSTIEAVFIIAVIYTYGGHIFLFFGTKILGFLRILSAHSERKFFALSYFSGFMAFLTSIVVTNMICGNSIMMNGWSSLIAFCIMSFAAAMSALVFGRFYSPAR